MNEKLPVRVRAFALPITLSLLALLVLAVLALSSLVKIGSRVADATVHQERARQNALLALDRALGALQVSAGADRRVTARAESITGCAEGKRFWTGVWDDSGNHVRWLVSGTDDSISTAPAAGPDRPLVTLVDTNAAGTTTPVVSVQADPVLVYGQSGPSATEAVVVGHLAYWVSDEGVKATVRFDETMDRLKGNGAGQFVVGTPIDDTTKRLRQMLLPRPRIDLVSDKLDPATITTRTKLGNIEELAQLPYAATGTVSVVSQFHDLTAESLGVLSNPVNGGLKRDVSDSSATSALGDNIDAWLRIRPQSTTGAAATHAIAAASGGFSVAPVITEFAVRFRFFRNATATAATGNLAVRCQMQVELWNPYSSTLSGNGTSQLGFRVSGLPTNFTVQTGNGVTFTNVNLQEAFDAMSFTLPANTTFAPGSVAVFYGGLGGAWSSTASSAAGNIYDFGASFAILGTGTAANRWVDYNQTRGDTNLTAAMTYGGASVATYAPNISYSPVTFIHPSAGWTEGGATSTTYQFGYGYSLRDSFARWANGAASGTTDPRSIAMNGDFAENPTAGSPATQWRTDPIANAALTIDRSSSAGAGTVFYNSTAANAPNYILFELPRQAVLSLGSLQHVPGVLPNEIGNPWGGTINSLFDSSFMSTLPQTDPAWINSPVPLRPPSPNAYLQVYRGSAETTASDLLNPASASAHLLVRGAFNVNSTSAKAWKMVIGGARVPAGYTLPSAALGNALFRHSHSAQEYFATSGAPTSASKPTGTTVARKQGARDLSEIQIDALANAIALLNRGRARPALSLQDFLNSGVIAQALAPSVTVLGETASQATNRQGINDGTTLVAGMPSYLSQADIVTSIAPFIAARSDTFRIRAYGDSVNPLDPTQTESRAYCEAVVQRVPEYFDATQAPTATTLNATNARYGRRFKVLSFRWLGPGDI